VIVLDQEQKDILNKIFRGSVADAVVQLLNMREQYGEESDLAIAASQVIEMDGQDLLVKVTVSLEAIEDDEEDDDGE
jgi:hypothetical protein